MQKKILLILTLISTLITKITFSASAQNKDKVITEENYKLVCQSDKSLKKIISPLNIRLIISQYLLDNKDYEPLELYEFSSQIDITDREVLSSLVSPIFQKKSDLNSCIDIARRIYETKSRTVFSESDEKQSWGVNFSAEPEVLAYAMQHVRNKIVLEIGGASGEHAIMFAFAGAKKVYLNDISPMEIRNFNIIKSKLPIKVSEKIETIEGSCFDLIKRKDLIGKIDFILCRNLIHFFTDEKLNNFFEMVKQLLKPGGYAIFTANSIYPHRVDKSFWENNPDTTTFTTHHCLLTDLTISRIPFRSIYYDISVCSDSEIEQIYREFYIYKKSSQTNYKWQVDNIEFKKLAKDLKPKIKQACEENKKLIQSINCGYVRVLKNWFRLFRPSTLSTLFKKYGFDILQIFTVDPQGHLVHDKLQDQYYGTRIRNLGAIVRFPGNDS